MFLIADADQPEHLLAALRELRDCPFAAVYAFPGVFGKKGAYAHHLVVRRNIARIERVLREYAGLPKRVFVANDQRPESQYVMFLAKKANHGTRVTYIEDGGAVYCTEQIPRTSRGKTMAARIIYGKWWHEVPVQGTHPLIDDLLVMWPDSLRPELRGNTVAEIRVERLQRLLDSGFINLYLSKLGVDLKCLADTDAIVILPHSTGIHARADADALARALAAIQRCGVRLSAKYHPREAQADYLNLAAIPDLKFIPRACPMEAVFLSLRQLDRKVDVIGVHSTSLLTAKWILKSLTVHGYFLEHSLDPHLCAVARQAGIHVHSLAELTRIYEAKDE
ncbi:MAG: hypothetical protein ACM3ZC_16035 [Bacteroidota bacterium]